MALRVGFQVSRFVLAFGELAQPHKRNQAAEAAFISFRVSQNSG
jgi:hypothetical protein